MATLAQLKKQKQKISDQIWEIENKERQKELTKAVGKFFKYRNCYSCPKEESDYWFMYSAGYSDGEGVKEFRFQTDKYGKTEFEVTDWHGLSGYVEISAEEFFKAYGRAVARVGHDFGVATQS